MIMSMTGHKTTSVFKRYNTVEEADVLEARRRIEAFHARNRKDGQEGKTG